MYTKYRLQPQIRSQRWGALLHRDGGPQPHNVHQVTIITINTLAAQLIRQRRWGELFCRGGVRQPRDVHQAPIITANSFATLGCVRSPRRRPTTARCTRSYLQHQINYQRRGVSLCRGGCRQPRDVHRVSIIASYQFAASGCVLPRRPPTTTRCTPMINYNNKFVRNVGVHCFAAAAPDNHAMYTKHKL